VSQDASRIGKLILVAAVITLAVTLLRLVGELQVGSLSATAGHGLVTEHQNVRCLTVLSKAVDSPGFSTLRAGRFCCSALRAFRNQQVLGSSPSAGSKSSATCGSMVADKDG
jgi:hypothetical protein